MITGESFDLRRIGEVLRETRESKGLSLGDVSDPLFLTKSTLGAIESGHWEVLPHPVYVKGYIKSYAGYLDVSQQIEEHLCPAEASRGEGRAMVPAARSREATIPEGSAGHFWLLPLKGIALLCSSVVGLAFGMTSPTLPPLQETPFECLKGLITAVQTMVISL
jgi:cytoskeleton protein RodZ